ncbi:hypothetical protein AB0E01_18030 [Nocardia vinacea]|uniref:hypothetical protein n=1 Tax=Nocardia vinacea TaxID=96468 RepID=UPI0033E00AE7
MNTPPASTETVAAARLLLTQMGISPADLVTVGATAPTFAEIVPRVRETLKPGTKRTYGTHLDRLEQQWPDRHLDQVSKPDLDEMARAIQLGARVNRASRGGASAVEHFISAARCVYRHAEDHGWIRPCDNPARNSRSRCDVPPTDTRSPRASWPRSARPRPPPATTPNSTLLVYPR